MPSLFTLPSLYVPLHVPLHAAQICHCTPWRRYTSEGLGVVGLGAGRGGLLEANEDRKPLGGGHRDRRVRA
eukprot:4614258-Pyramimonas_sp.AAC.1